MITYISYFDDKQIEEYNLKADNNTILFKANDESISGDSINRLNTFYCELTTLYWIWKNDKSNDMICHKQYRRPFNPSILPKNNEVVTYAPFVMDESIEEQFSYFHGKRRSNDICNILIKLFGPTSAEVKYWKRCKVLLTNNTFIMNRGDFNKMCEFVFRVLFELDKRYKLDFNSDKYIENSYIYTEDDRYDYQQHFMAYIGERLTSMYIYLHLFPKFEKRLENNGFMTPYSKS
jgi:hypothetical protein